MQRPAEACGRHCCSRSWLREGFWALPRTVWSPVTMQRRGCPKTSKSKRRFRFSQKHSNRDGPASSPQARLLAGQAVLGPSGVSSLLGAPLTQHCHVHVPRLPWENLSRAIKGGHCLTAPLPMPAGSHTRTFHRGHLSRARVGAALPGHPQQRWWWRQGRGPGFFLPFIIFHAFFPSEHLSPRVTLKLRGSLTPQDPVPPGGTVVIRASSPPQVPQAHLPERSPCHPHYSCPCPGTLSVALGTPQGSPWWGQQGLGDQRWPSPSQMPCSGCCLGAEQSRTEDTAKVWTCESPLFRPRSTCHRPPCPPMGRDLPSEYWSG
nr:uncharacterized protein LOC102148752 isoform X1 [Equus caballus]XP_023504832.1 uncharacterized protein LOC102148752 isoform X1 [Equus caballus]XP_023504833.1 uncharacterized protein LOC102148752 isoform X1 [Equus caballus]XP_023504835.1 uncharacterized protein LOC102148752 isoform X1 [Equus caballus]